MNADDIKVYKLKVENKEASCDVQAAINFVEKWTNTWELGVSAEKSHYLVVQSKSQSHRTTYVHT